MEHHKKSLNFKLESLATQYVTTLGPETYNVNKRGEYNFEGLGNVMLRQNAKSHLEDKKLNQQTLNY